MRFQERLARAVLLLIIVGLPAGILGHQHIQRSGHNHFEIRAYAPEAGGFSIDYIQVNAGEPVTLRFTSMDVTHGVAIGPGLGIDLGYIEPGKHEEVTLIFDEPGTYTYYCTTWCSPNHWRMRGVIAVHDAENPNTMPRTQTDPVIERLVEEGINIDALHSGGDGHEGSAGLTSIPVVERGAQFAASAVIPDELRTVAWQRTHAPVEAQSILQALNPSLSDTDLVDLVAYLWAANLEYDATTIRAYNLNCAACHGETGLADGPAASLTAVEPAEFADPSYMFAMRGDVLYAKTRRGGMGTDMPNFGTLFTQEETWALVDYLWRLALQPDP